MGRAGPQGQIASAITRTEAYVKASAERDRLWTLTKDMLARGDYDGHLVAVNPAWAKVLGWSEDKLQRDPNADIIHPDDVDKITELIEG